MDGIRIAHTEKRGCAFVPLCVCTYDRDGKEADRHRCWGKPLRESLGGRKNFPTSVSRVPALRKRTRTKTQEIKQ